MVAGMNTGNPDERGLEELPVLGKSRRVELTGLLSGPWRGELSPPVELETGMRIAPGLVGVEHADRRLGSAGKVPAMKRLRPGKKIEDQVGAEQK
jgi:hypothetical protein